MSTHPIAEDNIAIIMMAAIMTFFIIKRSFPTDNNYCIGL